MIVAAVDVSGSISSVPSYGDKVYSILSKLKPPFEVIRWNTTATTKKYEEITPDLGCYSGSSHTEPQCFLNLLPSEKEIDLYVFTDGAICTSDVNACVRILQRKKIQLCSVKIYFIGNAKSMNLKFIDLFIGIPQEIYINQETIGCIEPHLNFEDVDYNYIMKDDSFKATVLSRINSPCVDKKMLKKKLCVLNSRILKDYFKEKTSIKNFYESKNVDGCVAYVKKHSYYEDKVIFQRKMSEIMKLFDANTDTYSLDVFTRIQEPPALQYIEPELEYEELECDILYENCKTVCFPVKVHMKKTTIGEKVENSNNFCIDKKSIKNPFKVLESTYYRQEIAQLVEPYTIDYKTYKSLVNPQISPFTRDKLQGVYVLYNDTIDVHALIKHNNYVLSTLFENKLPGKPVLWHIVFLYILAVDKLQHMRERLFKEIRFLGDHDDYFVTLSPHLNPPIVEKLNICFWYIANICHKAFPNSKKNLLRLPDFNSGVILEFYKDVYDGNYENPKEFPLWQLWRAFCDKPELAIFNILTHYFAYEKYTNVTESEFQIVLYKELKNEKLSESYSFLSHLNLKKILSLYEIFKKRNHPTYYDDIHFKEKDIEVWSDEKDVVPDTLPHVRINLKTCHPYVRCPLTKKHWKECAGNYNVMKNSHIRLFRRYCLKYNKYPESSENLAVFLNEYIFKKQERIPEFFFPSLKCEMENVLSIFKEVMETYSCSEYLENAEKYVSETYRSQYE